MIEADGDAATLASAGFFCFLLGRVTGAAMLRRVSAHKMLGLYSVINAVLCFLIFLKLGWLSVVCVFLCYFFMSITFPTIFALGIFGLGARAKAASAYIVMGIVGGALLPKLMGAIAERLADHVVVTSDNPRDEAPSYILSQILVGVIGHDGQELLDGGQQPTSFDGRRPTQVESDPRPRGRPRQTRRRIDGGAVGVDDGNIVASEFDCRADSCTERSASGGVRASATTSACLEPDDADRYWCR